MIAFNNVWGIPWTSNYRCVRIQNGLEDKSEPMKCSGQICTLSKLNERLSQEYYVKTRPPKNFSSLRI